MSICIYANNPKTSFLKFLEKGIEYCIPEYTLEEKEKEIVIVIVAPLSKPKEAAFVLEKDVFTFDSPPYLLKFKLPHPVFDRFSQQAYDSDTKAFKIKLKKAFEFIEKIIDDDDDDDDEGLSLPAHSGKSAFNETEDKKQFYGFANKYSNMFGKFYEEFSEVISVPNPDYTSLTVKRKLREKEENEKWSDDHYLADTMETDHLDSIFKYRPPWVSLHKEYFSNDEKEMLSEIIDKLKLDCLSEESVRLSEFQIIDILFGFAYNKRTTEGENTVESGWTINKLSSTLCWFEVFEDIKSVILSCFRRSLIFPLYRSWKLTTMIVKDVINILEGGPKQVTGCLLEVREIFNESDNRYILNNLYVNDLCNFAVHLSVERCHELAAAVAQVKIRKCDVNFDLTLLEMAAQWALLEVTNECVEERDWDVSELVNKLKELNLDLSHLNISSSESESEDSDSTNSSSEEE